MTTTPNARVILPAEATEEMLEAGEGAVSESYAMKYGRVEAARKIYRAMLTAAPASGKVTEAELSTAYAAAKEACEGCTSNFCGDCDCDGFTCKEGIRAALSALGLEVEG